MNKQRLNYQLNPYAIQLCSLTRWIAQQLETIEVQSCFSIRTAEHQALCVLPGVPNNCITPADLNPLQWPAPQSEPLQALHCLLYQQNPHIKVVLHTYVPPSEHQPLKIYPPLVEQLSKLSSASASGALSLHQSGLIMWAESTESARQQCGIYLPEQLAISAVASCSAAGSA